MKDLRTISRFAGKWRARNLAISKLSVFVPICSLCLLIMFTGCDEDGHLVVDHSLTQDLTTPAYLLPPCEEFESQGMGPEEGWSLRICDESEVDLRCRFVAFDGKDAFGDSTCSCRAVCHCRSAEYWRERLEDAHLVNPRAVPSMWDCQKYDCDYSDPSRCEFSPQIIPAHF